MALLTAVPSSSETPGLGLVAGKIFSTPAVLRSQDLVGQLFAQRGAKYSLQWVNVLGRCAWC